jgi:hypothetical protein
MEVEYDSESDYEESGSTKLSLKEARDKTLYIKGDLPDSGIEEVSVGNMVKVFFKQLVIKSPYRVSYIDKNEVPDSRRSEHLEEKIEFRVLLYPSMKGSYPLYIEGSQNYSKRSSWTYINSNNVFKCKRSESKDVEEWENKLIGICENNNYIALNKKLKRKNNFDIIDEKFKSKVKNINLVPDCLLAEMYPTVDTLHYKI